MQLTYALRPRPGAIPTGRLASAPMRTDASAETDAVVVIKSRWISERHVLYAGSSVQPSFVEHTQVPPESVRMDALTEIWENDCTEGMHSTEVKGDHEQCTPWRPVLND